LPSLEIPDLIFDDGVEPIDFVSGFVQQILIFVALVDVFSYLELIPFMISFQFVKLILPVCNFLLSFLDPSTFCVEFLFITHPKDLKLLSVFMFKVFELKIFFFQLLVSSVQIFLQLFVSFLEILRLLLHCFVKAA
jgi:hypothetical protein